MNAYSGPGKGKGSAAVSLRALAGANARRAAQAGARDAEALAAVLASGAPIQERHRRVAEARIANPGMSWAELDEALGVSADYARTCCRRLTARAASLARGDDAT